MDNLLCEYDFDCNNCVWHDDILIKTYYLYDNKTEIDQVQDYCIELAVDFFRDNYTGNYTIICDDKKRKVLL